MRETRRRDAEALPNPSMQPASRNSATVGRGDADGAGARVPHSGAHADGAWVRSMAHRSTQGPQLDSSRGAESSGVASSTTCPHVTARVPGKAMAIRVEVFARKSEARSKRADGRDSESSTPTDSYASSAHGDGARAVMCAIAELRAEARAKAIRDTQLPTMVELQSAELHERGLPPTAPLDRYLRSLPSGVYESLR